MGDQRGFLVRVLEVKMILSNTRPGPYQRVTDKVQNTFLFIAVKYFSSSFDKSFLFFELRYVAILRNWDTSSSDWKGLWIQCQDKQVKCDSLIVICSFVLSF